MIDPQRLNSWLDNQENYYRLLYQLVHNIPSGEFYKPEVTQSPYADYQEDIQSLSERVRIFGLPEDKRDLFFLTRRYEEELGYLLAEKRLTRLTELLSLSREEQKLAILDLVSRYRMERFIKRLIYK